MSFFQNTCKPKGFGGRLMCSSMNCGHKKVSLWGLQFINVDDHDYCLDIGCGGGANVKRLLKEVPYGHVVGLDYSEVSIAKTSQKNKKAVEKMHCKIVHGDVMDMPFKDNVFNIVTAFETIYFWPDLTKAFRNVYKVMKEGGTFLIVNEGDGETDKDDKWVKKIEGMKIYNASAIKETLKRVGFKEIIVYHEDKKHWLAITCTK